MSINLNDFIKLIERKNTESLADQTEITKLFPNTWNSFYNFWAINLSKEGKLINVGVNPSGDQDLGGHNFINDIFDEIKAINKDFGLYGFLNGSYRLVVINILN